MVTSKSAGSDSSGETIPLWRYGVAIPVNMRLERQVVIWRMIDYNNTGLRPYLVTVHQWQKIFILHFFLQTVIRYIKVSISIVQSHSWNPFERTTL